MQFSHIWAETGKPKKLYGRLCWHNQIYRVVVWKLRTSKTSTKHNTASSSLSRGRQETEAGKNAWKGDTKPLGSRKKPFQIPRRTALSPEKGKMAAQAGMGEGMCFYRTHSTAKGLHFPRDRSSYSHHPGQASPGLEVMHSYCQSLQFRKVAYMGLWTVGQGG